jgi:endonuclease YncB( thermonuclease family)
LRIYVTLPGGELLNLALVRDGWAEALSKAPNLAHDAALRRAEAEAKAAGRGIWSRQSGLAVSPSAYRHAHGGHEEPASPACQPEN